MDVLEDPWSIQMRADWDEAMNSWKMMQQIWPIDYSSDQSQSGWSIYFENYHLLQTSDAQSCSSVDTGHNSATVDVHLYSRPAFFDFLTGLSSRPAESYGWRLMGSESDNFVSHPRDGQECEREGELYDQVGSGVQEIESGVQEIE